MPWASERFQLLERFAMSADTKLNPLIISPHDARRVRELLAGAHAILTTCGCSRNDHSIVRLNKIVRWLRQYEYARPGFVGVSRPSLKSRGSSASPSVQEVLR
jgi:hypothetical protein